MPRKHPLIVFSKPDRPLSDRLREPRNETEFVRALHEHLNWRGWAPFPQNSHVVHGGTRYVNGTPDIIAMAPSGITFFIECKTDRAYRKKDNGLSEDQMAVRDRIDGIVGTGRQRYFVVAPGVLDRKIAFMEAKE